MLSSATRRVLLGRGLTLEGEAALAVRDRPTRTRFVGLFCQPAGSLWRFVAVDSRTTESAQSAVNTGAFRKPTMPEEGLETPDTRIMIPPVFPVFMGDSADFGRQIGLFCQRACTKARSDGVPSGVHSRPREGNAFEGEDLGQPVEMRVSVQHGEAAALGGRRGDERVGERNAVVAISALRKLAECRHGSIDRGPIVAEHPHRGQISVDARVLGCGPRRIEDLDPHDRRDQPPPGEYRRSE
jgi:hypothetical protein